MSDLKTQFSFPSAPEQVAHVEPFVDRLAQEFGLTPDVHSNVLLSLTEAVTNAILHGNRGDLRKSVSISLKRQRDAIAIRVSDEGPGFDPRNLPDPTSPERLEECGGRGIHLMRHLTDGCKFMRGGSTVEMRWKL